ncbi:prephenate dehydratase [Cecembia sp.]|uniref:prephenate dehydratase n=1 Tax=Cecembia sp. TaxID=1898110 RepID=UPI0025BE6497|nr:prephenate dehydratase [Cecembia sp.]
MGIAIQGIPGSFHHQVVLDYFGTESEVNYHRTFEQAVKAVSEAKDQYAVLAIENSIAGAILPNYELIDRYGLHISGEYYLPISHNLLALPGQKIADIKEVRSHPMALLQCKKFFQDYPDILLSDDLDTATVAKRIAEESLMGVAAVASKAAAEIYQLQILASDIQTVKDNFTRFIILQKGKPEKTDGSDKVSLKIIISNEMGSLAKLLTQISEYGLNLSKIQSVPVIEKPWDYAFFMDAHFESFLRLEEALKGIVQNGAEVKVLGEYRSSKFCKEDKR